MPDSHDPYDLTRFVDAQRAVYRQVVVELAAGRKRSHWMWYVFPQIAGLGFSAMSMRYAIASSAEAVAYLAHRILGPRLIECTRFVNAVDGLSLRQILGQPDDVKFVSSMTLFAQIAPDEPVFAEALRKYAGGAGDPKTLALLRADRRA
ncbi:MAG: DUF1810 domain-containing protein [Burkholderiaceae bacterium]